LDVFVDCIDILDVIGVGHIIDGDVGAKSSTRAVTRSSSNNLMDAVTDEGDALGREVDVP
jgi:hypothetical protein